MTPVIKTKNNNKCHVKSTENSKEKISIRLAMWQKLNV
jgi:hypothetical protein